MKSSLDILQHYWGYTSFRASQEKIIDTVVAKKDTVALLPTGGGKSLCYQVPALLNDGICLVISPLLSLMKDQIKSLKDKDIKAAMIETGMSVDDIVHLFDTLKFDHYKFLYLSPERLQSDLVLQKIKELNINLLAIDEAHCISEWGHDFRPSYRLIQKVKQQISDTPIIAVTATATQKVLNDIVENLELIEPAIFRDSFTRHNLGYQVLKKEDKLGTLLSLLKSQTKTSIVYTTTRKKTEQIAQYLNQKGLKATFYHGGLSKELKEENFNLWLNNHANIMIATNAFGMGIDKDDVASVIHVDIPLSIENYVQEAGRAGRNGEESYSYLIANNNDIAYFKEAYKNNLPTIDFIKSVHKNLYQYHQIVNGELIDDVFDFNLSAFCNHYQFPINKTTNALQILKSHAIIDINSVAFKKSEVQFLLNSNQLQSYQNNHTNKELINFLLRAYGGIFHQPIKINEFWIAKKLGVTSSIIIKQLKDLELTEIIHYNKSKEFAELQFLVPREDNKTINRISKEIQHYLNNKTQKAKAIINYINNQDVCRNQLLLSYFDETTHIDCGKCDVCLANTTTSNIALSDKIIGYLKSSDPKSILEISLEIKEPEEDILIHLRKLIAEDKVGINTLNKCYLK